MSISRILAIALRHYYLALHQLDRMLGIIYYPTMSLILWGFVSRYVNQVQSSILASFLLGGLILWTIFESTDTDIGLSFMFDVWERNIVNIFASPISLLEYMTAFLLVGLVKVLVSLGIMGVLAFLFYGFTLTTLGFYLALFWVNLVLFGWAFGIFNVALVLRLGSRLGPLTWSLPFLLMPVSAVFYPLSVLPESLQKVAYFIPLSHVFEGMRYTLSSGRFDSAQFYTALAFNAVYIFLASLLFAYTFRAVKRNGLLVKLI